MDKYLPLVTDATNTVCSLFKSNNIPYTIDCTNDYGSVIDLSEDNDCYFILIADVKDIREKIYQQYDFATAFPVIICQDKYLTDMSIIITFKECDKIIDMLFN